MTRHPLVSPLSSVLSLVAVAAGLCQAMGSEAYKLKYPRPGPCSCVPNSQNFGYFPTHWRQWPGEYRPEISNPLSIGRTVLPTPEGQPEQAPQQGAPMLPPPSGGGILPPSGESTGPATAPSLELPPELQLTPPTGTPELGPSLPGLPVLPGKPGARWTPAPSLKDRPQQSKNDPSLPDASPDGTGRGTAAAAAFEQPVGQQDDVKAVSDVRPTAPPAVEPKPSVAASSEVRDAKSREVTVSAPLPEATGAAQGSPAAEIGHESDGEAKATSQKADETPIKSPAPVEASEAVPAVPTVALQGFCPVDLVRHGRWTPGDLRWTVVYQGHIYRLSGASQRREFLSNPEAFAPAYAGNDAVVAVDEHRMVPGKTAHCAVYNGHLYMFSSAASQSRFNQEPERYLRKQ